MIDVLYITLPIYIMIAVGFVATRFGAASPADIRSLGTFVIRFALPALLYKSLADRPFVQILNAQYLVVYALASSVVFAAMYALARFLRPRDPSGDAIQALGSSCANSGFVGFPIALLFVGPPATVAVALTMIVENFLVIPLSLSLAESGRHLGKKPSAVASHLIGRLARNPMIIAIALGAATSFAGIALPIPLARAVDMLALGSGAAALFVVGGTLVGLKVGGVTRDAVRIVAGKQLLFPLVILAMQPLLAPALDGDLRKSMLIFASSPTLSIFPLIGRQYGQERVCAAAVLLATALSFLTMSTLLFAL